MIQTWPEDLPRTPLNTFYSKGLSGLLDDQEIINPARTRTYPEREITFKIKMTMAEFKRFRLFYESTLNGGAVLFTVPWLETVGLSFHRVRFAKAYTATGKNSGKWTVAMPLEIIAGVPYENGKPAIWMPEPGDE